MAQLVKALVDCPMGPGFESQVPQYVCCYFLSGIPVSLTLCNTSCTFTQRLPDGLQAKSDGPSWRSTMRPSQPMHVEPWKVMQAGNYWAWNFLFSPPIWAHTPLGYFFSFLYFHFIYFILIIIFIV